MLKLILAAVMFSISFSSIASKSEVVEKMIADTQVVQKDFSGLTTDLVVKSVAVNTALVVDYIHEIDGLINQQNPDVKKVQEAFLHMKKLLGRLDSSWKEYQSRNGKLKKELLSSYQIDEDSIERLLEDSNLFESSSNSL